jgi:hypothetical protein
MCVAKLRQGRGDNVDINDNHTDETNQPLKGGLTEYDFKKNHIQIKIDASEIPEAFYAILGDELTTAEQFEDGKIGYAIFIEKGQEIVGATGYDMYDEYETKVGAFEATNTAQKAGITNAKSGAFTKRLYEISKNSALTQEQKNQAIQKEFSAQTNGYEELPQKVFSAQEVEVGNNKTSDISTQKKAGNIKKAIFKSNGKTQIVE